MGRGLSGRDGRADAGFAAIAQWILVGRIGVAGNVGQRYGRLLCRYAGWTP